MGSKIKSKIFLIFLGGSLFGSSQLNKRMFHLNSIDMKNQANNQQLVNTILLKHIFLFVLALTFTLGTVKASPIENENTDGEKILLKINGKVTTDEGTIPGVNVYLKGTQTGTLTDKDGTFTFPKELKEGDILVFSFLGYETLEYTIKKENPSFIEINLNAKSILITGALADNSQPRGMKKFMAKIKAIF